MAAFSFKQKREFFSAAQSYAAHSTALLIGNGKSILGDILLNGKAVAKGKTEKFRTATDGYPTTQVTMSAEAAICISSESSDEVEVKLNLIDTPGLNEDPKKDLEHMIGIVKEMKNIKFNGMRICC